MDIQKNSLSTVSLKVVSNGYAGTPKSFLLSTISHNYLFNTGEGTQRIIGEFKFKLNKIKHLFITRKSWDCFGGFVGTSLTLQEQTAKLTVHSPFDVKDLVQKTYPLGNLAVMNFTQHDYRTTETFDDESVNVRVVEFVDNEEKDEIIKLSCIEEEVIEQYTTVHEEDDKPPNEKKAKTDEEVTTKAEVVYKNSSYAYIVTVHKPNPIMKNENLEKFKVPNGPLRKELKSGNDITLSDGRVIYAKDILDYSNIYDVKLLVIDIPNENFIETVESNADLNDPSINIIVHLSSTNVLNNKRYQDWIKSKLNVKHLILDEKQENIELLKMRSLQKTLNLIDDQIFPVFPKFEVEDVVNRIQHENVFYGLSKSSLQLRPSIGFNDSDLINIDEEEFVKELVSISDEDNILQILGNFRNEIKLLRDKQDKARIYPIVTFLGTGSSMPCSTRNVSAVLVGIDEHTNFLLDCGEGTIGQMKRLFGKERFIAEMRKLKSVYISHFHADHHQGLFKVIKERKKIFDDLSLPYEKLYLCTPANIAKYFRMYYTIFDKKIFSYLSIVINSWLYSSTEKETFNILNTEHTETQCKELKECLKLKSIQTVPVVHVPQSTALIFETLESENSPSFKLVFSGDCRPAELLAKYGENCDLLIHEATFDESLKTEAVSKKHSTILEAVDIGKQMKAKHVILWHFSQRYAKVPLINDISTSEDDPNVSVSFDNMCVNRNDLELLPKFNETYKTVFREYHAEAEIQSIKKSRKNKL